jgi:hypothetical protein
LASASPALAPEGVADTMIRASAADESVAAVNCMAFRVTVFIEVCLPFARSSDIDPIRIHTIFQKANLKPKLVWIKSFTDIGGFAKSTSTISYSIISHSMVL